MSSGGRWGEAMRAVGLRERLSVDHWRRVHMLEYDSVVWRGAHMEAPTGACYCHGKVGYVAHVFVDATAVCGHMAVGLVDPSILVIEMPPQ